MGEGHGISVTVPPPPFLGSRLNTGVQSWSPTQVDFNSRNFQPILTFTSKQRGKGESKFLKDTIALLPGDSFLPPHQERSQGSGEKWPLLWPSYLL